MESPHKKTVSDVIIDNCVEQNSPARQTRK